MALKNKVRLNLSASKEVYEYAKVMAEKRGMSMAVWIEQLIRDHMEKEEKKS